MSAYLLGGPLSGGSSEGLVVSKRESPDCARLRLRWRREDQTAIVRVNVHPGCRRRAAHKREPREKTGEKCAGAGYSMSVHILSGFHVSAYVFRILM